jgi:S1-C subfamily serine protease
MRRIVGLALIGTILLVQICAADDADPTLRIRKATVRIMATYIHPNYFLPWTMKTHTAGIGTGAFIKGNLVLTNAHVVSDATFIQIQKENDPNKCEAEVAFIGHECDLALLKVKDPACLADTTALEIGDALPKLKSTVATYGFPLGGEQISITAGVVSRVEIRSYVHSGHSRFVVVQTDAAINPGNSGGPVVQDDKIVGVAFQTQTSADNIGYMVPAPIIRHFFKDISDGRFDGFPDLGAFTDELENKGYREYLSMKDGQSGVIVTHVLPGSSADGHIKDGDVLLRLEGVQIANDGSIPFECGRIEYGHLVDMKQVGESADLVVWRDRKEVPVRVPLGLPPVRVPWFKEFESLPRYYIFAGIIFEPLSREYLDTWSDWQAKADLRMLYGYLYAERDRIDPDRKEFVVISCVLPDSANTYVSDLTNKMVDTINGLRITRLEDVVEAFKKPLGKFHVIGVEGKFKPIVLNAAQAAAADPIILKNYGVPGDRRLDRESGYGRK